MLIRLLRNALIAGFISGILLLGLQLIWVAPVLSTAEYYRNIARTEHSRHSPELVTDNHRDHYQDRWRSTGGMDRNLWTLASNSIFGFGISLLIGAALIFIPNGKWWHGLLWGTAGYGAFFVAPAIIAPPTLPSIEETDLLVRQLWWIATIEGTVFGLAIAVFSRHRIYKLMGITLMAAPHIVGGPPNNLQPIVPDSLATSYLWVTSLTTLPYWIVLGLVTTALFYIAGREKW